MCMLIAAEVAASIAAQLRISSDLLLREQRAQAAVRLQMRKAKFALQRGYRAHLLREFRFACLAAGEQLIEGAFGINQLRAYRARFGLVFGHQLFGGDALFRRERELVGQFKRMHRTGVVVELRRTGVTHAAPDEILFHFAGG